MLTTFSFGVSSNLSQQKSQTAKIIGKYFLGTIVLRKYMPIISTVGLFCYDKFEETSSNESNMSKLTKLYFNCFYFLNHIHNIAKLQFYPKNFSETTLLPTVREQKLTDCQMLGLCYIFLHIMRHFTAAQWAKSSNH